MTSTVVLVRLSSHEQQRCCSDAYNDIRIRFRTSKKF
jgi:hypothetical protein